VQGGTVGSLPDKGVGVDRTAPCKTEIANRLDMTSAVDELQVALLGRRGLAALPAKPVAISEHALDCD
jgi:hypothetical protein